MMMNFILFGVVNYLLSLLRVPATVHTKEILSSGRIPLLSSIVDSLRGSDANLTLALGLLLCAIVFYLFKRTRMGYELRAVGLNPKAAEYGGVAVPRAMMTSLLISGGLAGLGGVNFILGNQGYFEQGFAPNQGYLGIAVALLARNHPIGVIPAAFMFALLSEGGQSIQHYVPKGSCWAAPSALRWEPSSVTILGLDLRWGWEWESWSPSCMPY
jgi:simple sugar transport system permease protein